MSHTRLLFVNAHFAAHDHKVAQRQADYLRIKAGLFNTKEEPGASAHPCLSKSLNHLDFQKRTANSSVVLAKAYQALLAACLRSYLSFLLKTCTLLLHKLSMPHVLGACTAAEKTNDCCMPIDSPISSHHKYFLLSLCSCSVTPFACLTPHDDLVLHSAAHP